MNYGTMSYSPWKSQVFRNIIAKNKEEEKSNVKVILCDSRQPTGGIVKTPAPQSFPSIAP